MRAEPVPDGVTVLPEAARRARPAPTPWWQWMQFATVGVFNAIVDLGCLNLFLALWPPGKDSLLLTVENSLAVSLAIANSYVWNTRWTFSQQADGSLRQMSLFVAQSILNIGINDGALLLTNSLFLNATHLNQSWLTVNLSKGVAMAFASSTSFFIMRFYVFAVRHRPAMRPVGSRTSAPVRAPQPRGDQNQ